MRERWIPRAALIAFVLAGMLTGGAVAAGDNGRYKKQGTRCLWDANDSGPNQCTPVTAGRFKRNAGACVWVPNETGTDQCKPRQGRFKKEGSDCVWNATDSGPNQCDPRRAK